MNLLIVIHNWIVSLHPNDVSLLGTTIGAIITLLAAYIAVKTAFEQISRQFEQKIVYEGWKEFQKNLFNFSNALIDYSTTVQWLTYFVGSQDNPIVNGGNKPQYRQDKWQEITNSYNNLQKAYFGFLRSFENHEVIFFPLQTMKKVFVEEYRNKIENHNQKFVELLFPEMYGQTKSLSVDEEKNEINKYSDNMFEMSAFLDDCRVELQNETVGKILHKKVPRRDPPDKKYKVLTVNGLITIKAGLKEKIRNRFKNK